MQRPARQHCLHIHRRCRWSIKHSPTLQRYLADNDAINVTVVTDDPAPGATALPPRSYTSLKAVTAEIGDSR